MKANPRGNLRREILDAAHAVLAEAGYEAISIRKLAETVGVSSGAPYHHFTDRRAVLIALAAEGFARLDRLARAVLAERTPSAAATLAALGTLFLTFCEENPSLVELMYESEITRPIDPALRPAYQTGFKTVVGVIARARPGLDPRTVAVRGIGFWSTLFGLSRLTRNQLLEPFVPDDDDGAAWSQSLVTEAAIAALR